MTMMLISTTISRGSTTSPPSPRSTLAFEVESWKKCEKKSAKIAKRVSRVLRFCLEKVQKFDNLDNFDNNSSSCLSA
jgi:hypothetical protein